MANTYAIQTLVRLQAEFRALLTNELVDPSTVELILTRPDKTKTTVTAGIANVSPGHYSYDWVADVVGAWDIRWQGLGTVIVANLPYTVIIV